MKFGNTFEPLTPQQLETAVHLYREEGWGIPRISLHMGLRQSAIGSAFRVNKIPLRSRAETFAIQTALRERGVYVIKKRSEFA